MTRCQTHAVETIRTATRDLVLRTLGLFTIVVGAAWLAGAMLLAEVAEDGPFGIDLWGASLQAHRTPLVTRGMTDLTYLGNDFFVVAVFGLLAGIAYLKTRQRRWVAFFAMTGTGAVLLDNAIKPLVERARPVYGQLVNGRGFSFPSGHVLAAAALSLAIALWAGRSGSRRAKAAAWALAGAWTGGIAMTRVYLGVHWSSDVIAGAILGLVWTILSGVSCGTIELPRRFPLRSVLRAPIAASADAG